MTICIQQPVSHSIKKNTVDSIFHTKPDNSHHTLVVIDPSVDNSDVLVAGVKPNSKLLVLDPRRDSIEQIDELIQQYPNVESLHLVSHGTPGSLNLGLTKLDLESLARYRDTLKSWSNHLKNADLYIYGCQVARGKQGEDFLQQLHYLTLANLAASTEVVGNSQHRRNWQLNYRIGQSDRQLAFSLETIAAYSGTFEPVVSFSTSPDTLIETEGTILNFEFELSEAPPAGGVVVTVDGDVSESLNQLDLFAIEIEGGDSLEGDFDFSGFSLNITEPTATVSVPVFPDDDSGDAVVSDDDPLTPDDFVVTYALQPGDGYTIDPDDNSDTVSFFDTPEDVTTEPDDDDDELTVYRFFQPSIGSHLYTSSETEKDNIRENLSNYTYEGPSYEALDPLTGEEVAEDSNIENVYRFFNPTTGAHLYTASEVEKDNIQENLANFELEGVQFAVYNTDIGEDTIPIYRFYDPTLGVHFYTPNEAEKENVENNLPNYEYEGIAYYALDL